MVSLRRKKAMREEARRVQDAALKAARVGRTGQVVRSTVETAEGDVPVVDALTGGAEAVETTEGLLEDVDALDYGLGIDDLDQYQDAEDAAHEAQYQQIETTIEMGEDLAQALQDADQAVEDAANALTTSNGKNARRRGVTEPEPPPGGWVQGDQWVRDVLVGGVPKPTEVLVWNGTEFVHETLLTGEVLVVGEDGNVRIANGKVTGQALAAEAIDGKTITGALIRTAPSGQRMQFDVDGLKAIDPANQQVASISTGDEGLLIGLPDGSVEIRGAVGSDAAASVLVNGGKHFADLVALNNVVSQLSLGTGSAGNQRFVNLTVGHSGNPGGAALATNLRLDVTATDGIALMSPTTNPGNTFPTLAALNAWSAPDGTRAWVSSENREYVRVLGAWKPGVDVAGDTDWVDLPYTAGHQAESRHGPLQMCRVGGIVYFRGGASKTSGLFSTSETVIVPAGGVPEWARPPQHARFAAAGGQGAVGTLLIHMDGRVIVNSNTAAAWWAGMISYPAAGS